MACNRKIILVGMFCFLLVLGFLSPVMAAKEEEQEEDAFALTLTESDKEIMSYLRDTKSDEWHSGTLKNPRISYEEESGIYIVNEQPMYILKAQLNGGGLPARETVVKRGKNKVTIDNFLQGVNLGEITKVRSITYSRNKNNGMLVATEIVLK